MLLEHSDFVRSLALCHPAVGLVIWSKDADLAQATAGFIAALEQTGGDALPVRLQAEGHDGDWFRERLVNEIHVADANRTWLFVSKIEEVLGAAARVLNGVREQLGRFRGVMLFVRENRRSEFQESCPDLMDWIGLRICVADRFAASSGLDHVTKSLRRLEAKYATESNAFLGNPSVVEIASAADAWLWRELLAIRSELLGARQE